MTALEDVIQSLEQVQALDAHQIARSEALGKAFEFTSAVPIIARTLEFFRQIPSSSLQELGESQRDIVKVMADQFYSLYARIMSFDPLQSESAAQDRRNLIEEATSTFNNVFANLMSICAYIASRQYDPSEATRAAQHTLAELSRLSEEGTTTLRTIQTDAARILADVRQISAESGVSQQADYFDKEATAHGALAKKWQSYTNWAATGLGAWALVSLIFSIWWSPNDAYQTTQIALSKILIFSTIAFMLFLCSRTLTAHRHNEVINRHRRNALLTFNEFANATSDQQTREVVLMHASACIFGPQETGFGKPTGQANSPLVEVLPRILPQHAVG